MMNRHSPPFIAVESFDSIDEAAKGAEPWFTRAAQPHLFDRLEWFRNTTINVHPDAQNLIINARDGHWQGWLFLVHCSRGKATALASWYTLAYRPVFTPDTPERTRLRLLAAMADFAHAENGLGHITLAPVPGWDNSANLLVQAFQEAGWHCSVQSKTENWVHSIVEPSFADYLAGRPGTLRNTIKRKSSNSDLSFEIHDTITDKIWADYEKVFKMSWKGEEGSMPFLRSMAETEGAAGCLRLGIARLDNQAVATQLWTIENGTAIIHKLAYDDRVKSLSAGTLLSAHMFQHVIDKDQARRIDYGTGHDAYKRDWMSECRMLVTIEAYHPRTLTGLKQILLNTLVRLARRNRSA